MRGQQRMLDLWRIELRGENLNLNLNLASCIWMYVYDEVDWNGRYFRVLRMYKFFIYLLLLKNIF